MARRWPRAKNRAVARFDVSLDKAERELKTEIDRLGGSYPLVTHNKFAGGRDPADPGVAVYFTVNGKQRFFACDRWYTVRDNIRAISKTIEALRGIERWGASEMMERAFSAFTALPAPSWRDDLGFPPETRPSLAQVEARYRELAKRWHPDTPGGNADNPDQPRPARRLLVGQDDSRDQRTDLPGLCGLAPALFEGRRRDRAA